MTVVDTEAHVIHRLWPIEVNPGRSLVEPHSWHAHTGDLLVDEMERAGVDLAFLIGYDGMDFVPYLAKVGSTPDDVYGGRRYARFFAAKHPQRLKFFTTLRDPRSPGALEALAEEIQGEAPVVGVKVFPSYLEIGLDDSRMMPFYEMCEDLNLRVIMGLEDTAPPRTNSFTEYWNQLDTVLRRFTKIRIQFNHAGAAPLPSGDADGFFELAARWDRIFVSTAYLGLDWPDEWRYPFPTYLSRLRIVYEALGPDRLMWGTDWPWLEGMAKYPQLVDSIRDHADFMSEAEKEAFLGDNAIRFLEES